MPSKLEIGAGWSLRIEAMSEAWVFPAKARFPVAIS